MALTNTVTQLAANQADLGLAITNAVEGALTTNGWTFVQTVSVTIGGVPSTARIWFSAAVRTKQGTDVYVALIRNTTAGTFFAARCFEAWDGVGLLMLRPCLRSSIPISTLSAVTWTIPVAINGIALDDPAGYCAYPSTAAQLGATLAYDIAVAVTASWMAVAVSPTGGVEVASILLGQAIPAYGDSAISFPPLLVLSQSNVTVNGRSRSVRGHTSSASSTLFQCNSLTETSQAGIVGLNASPEVHSQSYRSSRVWVSGTSSAGVVTSSNVAPPLGYLGDLYLFVENSVRSGDSVVLGGRTWIRAYTGPFSSGAYVPTDTTW